MFSTGRHGTGCYARITGAGTRPIRRLGTWPERCPTATASTGAGTVRRTSSMASRSAAHPYRTLAGTLRPRPATSTQAAPLPVDWMRMSPYPAAGSFTSRVFDAGSTVGWQQLTADQVHPAATSTGFEVRSGNVAAPDASWSSFVPVSGGAINLTGRYLQYRASLQTTDSGLSPTLRSVTAQLRRGPGRHHGADHHRPLATRHRHQRHHRLQRQRHLQ